MLTGNVVSTCRACGGSTVFINDERWELDPQTSGYVQVTFSRQGPTYCPLCGNSEVEFTDEDVNYWEQALRFSGIRVAPDTLALCKGLYKNWDAEKCTFIDYLKEFKKLATAKDGAETPA